MANNVYLMLHLFFLIPVISLVYSATRFDEWPIIVHEAWRWGLRLTGFLLMIAVVIWVLAIFRFPF